MESGGREAYPRSGGEQRPRAVLLLGMASRRRSCSVGVKAVRAAERGRAGASRCRRRGSPWAVQRVARCTQQRRRRRQAPGRVAGRRGTAVPVCRVTGTGAVRLKSPAEHALLRCSSQQRGGWGFGAHGRWLRQAAPVRGAACEKSGCEWDWLEDREEPTRSTRQRRGEQQRTAAKGVSSRLLAACWKEEPERPSALSPCSHKQPAESTLFSHNNSDRSLSSAKG